MKLAFAFCGFFQKINIRSTYMERRKFLKSTAALGLAAGSAAGGSVAVEAQTADGGVFHADPLTAEIANSRKTIPADFDRTYVDNAVVPFFLTRLFEGER